jgi:NAD(P)-dependent dehydrogenase (short-subunit alcohol dehydrogenase family)
LFVHHDVSDEAEWAAAVRAAVDEFGGLDILVNNGGVADLGTIDDTSAELYERTIAVTQTSVFLGMRTAAEALRASEHASVINISSIFGSTAVSAPTRPTTRRRARSGCSPRTPRCCGPRPESG